jgi:hypothetical protein
MNLTIANISTTIADSDLQTCVAAIGRQVTEHFQPEWGRGATVIGVTTPLKKGTAKIQGVHDAIIYLGDKVQDPTTGIKKVFGYHAHHYSKIPYGFVYLDICEKYLEGWTSTLSHEVLEVLADPDSLFSVSGPDPRDPSRNVHYEFEVCDPTQGDTYQINGVAVSNFVGRSYFKLSGGSGMLNYLNLPLAVFGVRPGGYFQYENGKTVHTVNGSEVTKEMLAAKKLMELGRRNARRAARLKGTAKAKSK